MQDITKAKCDSSSIPTGTEGRLIDKRDGKIYWVGKLKDGLCWMTQNLDYDGSGIESGNFTTDDVTNNLAKYYDPGEYINTQPTTASTCSETTTNTSLANCSGWKSFDKSYLTSENLDSIIAEKLHYTIGNYYNWLAATNGTGDSSITSGNASGSVCPTGWSLPLSGNNSGSNNNINGSFYKLVNGLTNTQITVAPYYFVYGGYVHDSTLYNAGSYGYYWSATAYSSTNAYTLYFNSSNVSPSNYYYYRYVGISVRCVAR